MSATTNPDRRSAPREVADGQEPFAIILGCSDSRVPAEIVFDQGLGDLFVIRVAGNIVAPSQIGSVEFAAERVRHAPGGGARSFAVRRHPRDHRRAAAADGTTSPAICTRSSTACGPRSKPLLRRICSARPRRAGARCRARQRLRLRRPAAARLGHPRSSSSQKTASASWAQSIRSKPASSNSSMAFQRVRISGL